MSQKPYHSGELESIRKKIDELDTRIHETLIERAQLVLSIGEEKRKNNIEIVQPAREARMIRRLLSRHRGALPEMAIVRIWRELVGAVTLLQTGLSVIVSDDKQSVTWDMAKDYFGSCLPMSRADSVSTALKAVHDGRVSFAVVPYPSGMTEETDQSQWWEELNAGQDNGLSVIVRLPHGDDPEIKNPTLKALVVSKTGFDSSDEDHSFLFIECDPTISRAKLVETAEKEGLKPISLTSKSDNGHIRHHFMEVDDYVGQEDARLTIIAEQLGDEAAIHAVGGYPVPPIYSKTVKPKSQPIPKAPE